MKNIVLDIGNVLVKWSPQSIIAKVFNDGQDAEKVFLSIFKAPTWYDLNLGKITENEAIHIYNQKLGIPLHQAEEFMHEVKESLTPVEGSFELLDELEQAGFPIYSITDNVREIINFLKTKYTFIDKFRGMAVSAELGVLKPDEKIYRYLLDQYNLCPEDSIFLDDLLPNVEGARNVGMQGIHFTTAAACREDLKKFGVNV